ncbi:uncharacterized protein [Miscanthus floridulus]|uniref:uncharacterized protein n=1 Tax=Miscanthus floridulus TaxID=154761 RepID=UPI00345A83E2
MEAHHAIIGARNKEKPMQLSQQELVDCDPGSDKCAGGFAGSAFLYCFSSFILPIVCKVYGKDKKCGLWNDHELLLVGYDSNTYILKNSYGDDGGHEGYGYLILPRPDTNCGMLREGGSYPHIGI